MPLLMNPTLLQLRSRHQLRTHQQAMNRPHHARNGLESELLPLNMVTLTVASQGKEAWSTPRSV